MRDSKTTARPSAILALLAGSLLTACGDSASVAPRSGAPTANAPADVPGTTTPSAPVRVPVAPENARSRPPVAPENARSLPPVAPENARSMTDSAPATGRFAREHDELDLTVTATSAAAVGVHYRARYVPGYPGLVEFVLNNTGSGWVEKFLVQLPPTPPTSPVPMLVVFHKFGSSHGDVINTTFLAETQARGWYCVAPLGARQKNFGNNESQINTRAALDLVASILPVDRDRVYGVGFSMGGGGLANYAARHLDPAGVQFAAICDHTGGVSLAHTWFNEPDDADLDDNLPLPENNLEVPDVLESLFGGTPMQQPFNYRRASSIDLDPITGQIGASTDMGRNLAHIPTAIWIASADPMVYLGTQTYAFDGYLQNQNASHTLTVPNGNVHSWSTLDETAVCDWLQTKTLQQPTSGNTLADEDGVWFHFQIEQDVHGAFTPFTWTYDVATRHLDITQTANLKRITFDAAATGFSMHGNVTLHLESADGTGDSVRLLGVGSAPISVLRDGVSASGTFDAFTQSFEIVESSAGAHDWVLNFP